MKRVEPWIHTYAYPNMSFSYVYDITKGADGLFVVEDWHNMAMDLVKTFTARRKNFIDNYPLICHQYDDRFYKTWIFLMSGACAMFKSGKYQLAQIIFTKAQFEKRYNVAR